MKKSMLSSRLSIRTGGQHVQPASDYTTSILQQVNLVGQGPSLLFQKLQWRPLLIIRWVLQVVVLLSFCLLVGMLMSMRVSCFIGTTMESQHRGRNPIGFLMDGVLLPTFSRFILV